MGFLLNSVLDIVRGIVLGIVNRVAVAVLTAAIRAYQLVVSPWVTQQCKYYPSCSAYGLEAVRRHGAVRGARLAVWRILRCNPWSAGGVDHVPGTMAVATTVDPENASARPVVTHPSDLARI